jgi:hypothetical protein
MEEFKMSGISNKVKDYTDGRAACINPISTFDRIREVMNTLFDIKCSQKRKWGYEWYDDVRYGYYDKARREIIKKKPCLAKSVALKCIDELEYLERSERI